MWYLAREEPFRLHYLAFSWFSTISRAVKGLRLVTSHATSQWWGHVTIIGKSESRRPQCMAGASSVGDTFAKGIARNTASAHACKEIEQIGKVCNNWVYFLLVFYDYYNNASSLVHHLLQTIYSLWWMSLALLSVHCSKTHLKEDTKGIHKKLFLNVNVTQEDTHFPLTESTLIILF